MPNLKWLWLKMNFCSSCCWCCTCWWSCWSSFSLRVSCCSWVWCCCCLCCWCSWFTCCYCISFLRVSSCCCCVKSSWWNWRSWWCCTSGSSRSSRGVNRGCTFDGLVMMFSVISIKVSIVFCLWTNSVLKMEIF